jgi:hypothetical protein
MITLEEVKSVIGKTWFDFIQEGDRIDIESREYGDVSEETPGKEDMAEAKRIVLLLRDYVKNKGLFEKIKVTPECVDEWVVVTIQPRN